MSFLQETAKYIFSKHQLEDLQNQCVILPTRRAVFYFKQELAKLADKPFLAPEVFAVDDFFMKLSGKKLVDPVDLLFKLYDIFKTIDPNVELEKFATWAPTLLKDFDSIDQYLISPKEVFDYMAEAKAIERWNIELLAAGKAEFSKSNATDRYFKLFENLKKVYDDLHNLLNTSNLAYRGMAYREAAEGIPNLIQHDSIYEKYYFLGFNALSAAEEKVIETLMKANKAETLWDTDKYYMTTRHKAGDLLREYKNSLRFGKWNWLTDELMTGKKDIRIIGVQNTTLQAKVAGQIYAKMLDDNTKTETAIVLSDENMLLPLMYSLDEKVDDFNITMGLSLRNSMLFSFIDSIFELQQNIVEFKSKTGETFKIPKFSHRHVAKVLNHPFVRRYELKHPSPTLPNNGEGVISPSPLLGKESGVGVIRQVLKDITAKNLVFLSEKEILEMGQNEALFQILFRRWGDEPMKALQCFYQLVEVLRSIYSESQDAIEIEYLYLFYTILNRLEGILSERKDVKLWSFKTFLYEFIKQTKIPFSGEPISQLQIMGMLETRCLDFERLIILSVNEGILPASKKSNSLIPFDAALELGLPIHTQQDAVMSYHFFRLLQRAKHIDILYVLPTGEGVGGGGEKSRFIHQIEYDLSKINPNLKITKPVVKFSQSINNQQFSKVNNEINIQKNEAILAKLREILSQKGIYPSHLSQYIRCSLQYYFTQIAKVSERDEIDEKVGADIFGNWLHKTLENIDNDYSVDGREMTESDARQIILEIPERLKKVYETEFGGFNFESGMNFLLSQVAEKLLIDFFEEQIKQKAFPLKVLSVEKQLVVNFDATILGKVQNIKIAGRVDRVELKGNILKVVDYKTGKVDLKDLELDKDQTYEDALLHDANKEKLRQLWLYQYLMLKRMTTREGLRLSGELLDINNYEVKTKIYSFRNIKENLEKDIQLVDNQPVKDFIRESESLIKTYAEELLNPEIPFTQTTELATCEYCDFKGICGR